LIIKFPTVVDTLRYAIEVQTAAQQSASRRTAAST
jgi:hypothetical protein